MGLSFSGINLTSPRQSYRPDETITISYKVSARVKPVEYTPGSCWIGLVPSHITSNVEIVNNNFRVSWFYVDTDQGTGTLRTAISGTYRIKCFANDDGGNQIPVNGPFEQGKNIIIVGDDKPWIHRPLFVFPPEYSVSYDLTNCDYSPGSCWIGLIPSHITSTSEITNDQYHVCRFHVSQNVGEGTFTTSKPGRYRIKCFANDNGGKLLYDGEDIITIEDDGTGDDEKKVDKIEDELASIKQNPGKSRHELYELAKKRYKKEGKPVVIDTQDALSDIKQNAANYKNVALPMTLAMEKDFNTWNEQQFKRDFANRFNIPIECIEVVSVKAGSIITDVKLHTHWKDASGSQKSMSIEVIADKIDPATAKKAFAEFAVFAVEFKPPTAGFDCSKQKVIMNPKWNRAYGPGATDWDGPLNDGKSRGGEPYFCPKGWKRFAVQFQESALDFANTYDNWPIAYHGTKFDFSMMITLSGLKCFPGAHGCGVYLSPAIKYCSHPRYCKPVYLDLSKAKQESWTQEYRNEFKKYDKKWIQCAFMCRVKPDSYIKRRQTMGLGNDGEMDGISKKEIEWIVLGNHGSIIGPEKILIYGIMIRARDTQQTNYNDYE